MSCEMLDQLRAGALSGVVRLDLSAGLREVPEEVRSLAGSLEILNLSGNELSDLPDWLAELPKLRVLFCSDNPFQRVPEVLGACRALEMVGFKACQVSEVPAAALPRELRWLILTDNRLTELPAELGHCGRLQKLMLSGNRLRGLPAELAHCRRLELLRLAANDFPGFPDWLWEMPSLAWLAVAGNPCTALPPAAGPGFRQIPWSQVALGRRIGEGSSGWIHEAVWDAGAGAQVVAVKFFKGAMTSDGLPASEMAAGLAVGGHPHLIGAYGQMVGHPEAFTGLVMPLMDPAMAVLAGPPSLASCTRDVYPVDRQFTASGALRLLQGLAAGAAHLHGRGLLHGDLYAHNVLYHPAGQAVLGDFGAASFYPPGPAGRMERLEVRAFGILMEEVVSRGLEQGQWTGTIQSLMERCLQPEGAARPDFAEIQEALAGLG